MIDAPSCGKNSNCFHLQAKKELEEMSEMRRHTNQLLQNILPLHVAKYFLEQDRQDKVCKGSKI